MDNGSFRYSNEHDQSAIQPDLIAEDPPKEGFDLNDIATEEDDTEITGENILAHVEVRRPHPQEWFQTHPTWAVSTRAVIDKRGTKETVYLLHKRLMPWSEALEQDSVPVLVRICINVKGKIFIWVIRKSKDDGSLSKHYTTALEHVQRATTNWVRRFWLEDESRHVMRVAQISDKPAWPEGITLQDVMAAGFGSRIIVDESAQILKELRGENV
jgi:hypothetical protein